MDINVNHDRPGGSSEKLQRLLKLLQADPGNGSLARQCVETATAAGHFDVVVQLADAALAVDPTDAAAMFDKANGLIGQRDYRAALEALRQVEALRGPDTAIQSNRALCHYCLEEFEQAKAPLEACYEAGQRSAGLLRLLVSCYHHLGLIDEAVKVATANEAPAGEDGSLAGSYAILFLDANDLVRAARWSKTALRLNPGSVDGRVAEATLLTARMQTDRARQMLQSVVADAPATGRAWVGLGLLSMLDQQLDQAKQQLARGLEGRMGGHIGSWHVLGWAQLLTTELDAAERSFQRALELDRNFAETHGGLAVIAALRGATQRAEQQLTVALRLDPECLSARYAQAVLTGRSGDPAQAQKILQDTITGLAAKDGSALSKVLLKSAKL